MPPKPVVINGETLSLEQVRAVAAGAPVRLAEQAVERLHKAQRACQQVAASGQPVYGINTGFGPFARHRIPSDGIEKLQVNLIRSHASGYGEPLPVPVVRAMLVLRAHSLSVGYSGVGPDLVEALLALLREDVIPLVPEKGSVGASGDLAPLAHMALALLAEGEVFHRGRRRPAVEAFRECGLQPHRFSMKEGLALINGTQYMTAFGVIAIEEAQQLLLAAQVAAAMSIEAMLGSVRAFDAGLHRLRRHQGQQVVAANLRTLLHESPIVASHEQCHSVQDAYSLRCTPQILGASQDVIHYVDRVLADEVEAVTDNPLIFPEDGRVISGGNFHGQPLALALDHLGLAIAEIGSVSERRLYNLLYNHDVEPLPYCLTDNPGLQSGFMIMQYLAASLVSDTRSMLHAATLDNVVTGGGAEDHNSMGSIAAARLPRVLHNVRGIVAAELIAAAQALEYQRPLQPAGATAAALRTIRTHVAPLREDRPPAADVEKMALSATLQQVVNAVEAVTGELKRRLD